MKLKTMPYAALGAVTFKAGKMVAKKKTHDAVEDVKTRREHHETGRPA